jgi:hypothetical protein
VRAKFVFTSLVVILLLSACKGSATEIPGPTAVPTNTAVPTPTIVPTLSTPLAILVIPADFDQAASDLYQKTLYDLAQASGYRFQVRNTLTPEDLADSTLKIVVAVPPDPGVVTMAASAPNVQFLAVDIPGLTAGGNVSVLAPNNAVEIPAFLAGYVAAMLVEEYHIGMIIPKDDPSAQLALQAFSNGKTYYCGLCNTFYVTTITYPTYVEIPSDEDPSRYGGYANVLINDRKVDAMYIYPSLATQEFLDYVGTTGVLLIGSNRPGATRPGGWVMTIQPDSIKAIQLAWPGLIAGQGGQSVQSPIGLVDVDPSILTPGRERLARETLDALLAGRILPVGP